MVEVKCLEVVQPIGKFYVGVINYDDLEFISFVDVRRLKSEQRDVEEYIGIQRPLSSRREKEIGKYVNLVDATFPTSIILEISSSNASFNSDTGIMTIVRKQDVAKVLDGQHRIAGLNSCNLSGNQFQLNVTIFIDMELEDQAIVFSTINKTHTKVNKSLSYDLFEFATSRSPQRTAHNIARALNKKDGSPFKDKIKILGVANDQEKETITQATFVESLLKYISKDKMKDRDLFRRGKKPDNYEGRDYIRYFLRPIFLSDKDGQIAQTILNYFKAVETKWESAWVPVEPNKILNRSTGFIALMRFLSDIYVHLNKPGEVISIEEYSTILNNISISSQDFNRDNYLPGSGGQSKLYNDLKEKSGI